MRRLEQIFELTRVRVLLFLREPEAMFWMLAFPVVLAAVLGFAFQSRAIAPNSIAVLAGPGADALVERLGAEAHLEVELAPDRDGALRALFSGKLDLLVEIDGAGGVDAPPILHLDPARPEAETARLRVLLALGTGPRASVRIEERTERGSRYVDFLFPGLIGMNLMGTGMWVIGFAIAELRQKKLLRRMLVTPMQRSSLLVSFLTARMTFLVLEVGVLAGFGATVLDVPFRATVFGFAFLCFLGGTAFAGLGLLATARARTIQGASGLLNLAMLPMWLLSGVFFSYERFPEVLHPFIRLLPLTALNDALREMLLDGGGLADVWPELAILLGWGAVALAVSIRIFRWE